MSADNSIVIYKTSNNQIDVDLDTNIESSGTINFLNNNTQISGNVEMANGGVMNVGLNKNLEGYARKFGNPSFVERAPVAVVEEEKRRQAEALENKAKVEEALARIANF